MKSMHAFLVGALADPTGPAPNIRTLANEEATHDRIIESIDDLISGADIRYMDPVLIYFAGHGATLPPPSGEGWPQGVDIQCIVAHDAAVTKVASKTGYYSSGVVSDRVLNALIRELADKKGNNIVRLYSSPMFSLRAR
jgi:hypothetical protein